MRSILMKLIYPRPLQCLASPDLKWARPKADPKSTGFASGPPEGTAHWASPMGPPGPSGRSPGSWGSYDPPNWLANWASPNGTHSSLRLERAYAPKEHMRVRAVGERTRRDVRPRKIPTGFYSYVRPTTSMWLEEPHARRRTYVPTRVSLSRETPEYRRTYVFAPKRLRLFGAWGAAPPRRV